MHRQKLYPFLSREKRFELTHTFINGNDLDIGHKMPITTKNKKTAKPRRWACPRRLIMVKLTLLILGEESKHGSIYRKAGQSPLGLAADHPALWHPHLHDDTHGLCAEGHLSRHSPERHEGRGL